MNNGAADWQATTGWRLTSDAAYGGAGMSWQLMLSNATESLRWVSAIDLRALLPSQSVQLSFASNLQLVSGTARVEVSLDGGHQWLVAAAVTPSDDWSSQGVDVSAFAGQIIQLQFVWMPDPTTNSHEGVTHWGLDQVGLEGGQPVTVTPSATSSDSLATSEVAAQTETITPVTLTSTAMVAEPATESTPATLTPTPTETETTTATPTFTATVTFTPTETAAYTATLADLPAATLAP